MNVQERCNPNTSFKIDTQHTLHGVQHNLNIWFNEKKLNHDMMTGDAATLCPVIKSEIKSHETAQY